jgi:3-hydroxyacyl-CoA dehydrogenase/enoyl-CoA hydratase/3-hydroxybutyryl-CoA epimerase
MERAMGIACGDQVKRRGKSFGEALKSYLLEGTPIGRNLLFDLSQKAVKRATKGKYPAPLEAVKVIKLAAEGRREEAFKAESRAFAKLATSRVSKNLVHVLFKAMQESKELPVKVSFSPAEKTVGVLGAGVMGAGIAQAALFAGYKVVLGDVKQEFVDNGVKKINDLFQPLVERGKMSKESFKENMSRLSTAVTANDNYKDFANCDLVIEAVLEDLDLKKRVLKGLEAVIPAEKNFIFASNTSSLSIDSMAEAAANPNRVVGIHFFNPVHKMLLVEVVKGKTSDANTVATAMDFAMKLKKTVIVTKDSPGFVVNRILAPYLREAIVLMQEGVPVEDIDKAMKDFGMPMGPLRLLDEVGLDVAGKVIHVMHDAFGERLAPPAIMLKLESLKLLGKKGGKGVYTYGNIKKGKREVYDATGVNPDVQTAIADYLASINSSAKKKTREEIQDRLALAMVNEAIRCQEEHIVDKANQLDLAMVLGTGFAPFEGGVIRYADKIGAPALKQKLNALASVAGDNYKPAQLLENKALQEKGFYSLNGNGKVPH